MDCVTVAIYKGEGKFFNRFVRFISRGDYSHCEIVEKHVSGTVYTCVGSSFLDGGVRRKDIDLGNGKWDLFVFPTESSEACFERLQECIDRHMGYDALGLVTQSLNFIRDAKNAMFCSELVCYALGIPDGWRVDPCMLAKLGQYFGKLMQQTQN